MADDVEFGGADDVFAEIESDPLADEGAPPGVEEAELPGDNPSTDEPETLADAEAAAAPPPPEEVLQEPEESDNEPEPESPGEAEAAAAAAEPEPEPEPTPEAEPVAEPAEPEPAPDPTPEPEAAQPEPQPEPTAEEPVAPAEPAAEAPKPAAAAPKPEKKAKQKAAKKSKAKASKKGKPKRETTRGYIILYEIEGGWSEGARVTARSVQKALELAFPELEKATGQTEFSNVVAVPASNWNPAPLKGETETRSVISVGG